MSTNLDVLETEIKKIKEDMGILSREVKDMSLSQQEYGFILNTYMEKFPTFEKKIDYLTELFQEKISGKDHWDFINKVLNLEDKQKSHATCIKWLIIGAFAMILANPDKFLSLLQTWRSLG